jgi:hypothetical protein
MKVQMTNNTEKTGERNTRVHTGGLNQSPQTDIRTELMITVCTFNRSITLKTFTLIPFG